MELFNDGALPSRFRWLQNICTNKHVHLEVAYMKYCSHVTQQTVIPCKRKEILLLPRSFSNLVKCILKHHSHVFNSITEQTTQWAFYLTSKIGIVTQLEKAFCRRKSLSDLEDTNCS